ncbi:Glu/Leu/Phe/Val family dehydrogenase [Pontibacter arcticus]|uniref:Leucine dehydrogenase n=1 Tax=Pontibacter arcticus TaxID=2080288 RepID=A0A364RIV9_9BACT|nr:Glu/Leu/Phe/Val dehydrogenase [Pontibacter arcticus]RAU84178.1 leucine dehydrogenase [Pontibacter arcticus]
MVEIKEVELKKDKSIFGQISEYNHEKVVFCHDQETGLKAIIGIHNTVLGPALGGTRMWSYASDAEALEDVLRLSRGMTYKAAISGLNLGGGKAVIIGDAKKDKNEALLRRFGRFVKNLNGAYITAEDVGMTTKDMEYIRMETEHVSGLPESMGGSGDPSPVTAYGTYMGMKAAAKKAYGSDSLEGKKISVQGVGHVGGYLVELLAKENAEIFITDIYEDRLREISTKYGAKTVTMDEIYDLDVDIYSPCALGGTINNDTINRLKCQVIAGCANNQLRDETVHGPALIERGIVYAPDFLINAGGLINVYSELQGYNRESAYAQTERIYGYTLDIFELAEKEGIYTQLAATKMAEQRIQSIGKVKSTF